MFITKLRASAGLFTVPLCHKADKFMVAHMCSALAAYLIP